jgi:parallel beta-helix repeat protein
MNNTRDQQMAYRWLLSLLVSLTLCACGSANQPAAVPVATNSASPQLPTSPALAALADRVSPCVALEQVAQVDTAEQPPTVQAEEPHVSYDGDTNTIVVHAGGQTSLAAVSRALQRPDLLEETASGEWLLTANLELRKDAHLQISAPEVRWLKLASVAEGFVAIKVIGGKLLFADTCVSSWDSQRNAYDENIADGRSFVLAREGARMDVHRSELRYLGYDAHESFGVAWRMVGTTGEIIDSTLAYNYFGMYSYEASDLVMRGNEVHHNLLYGLDPHTRSKRLVIERNVVHDNGKHGIILADECSDSVVRENIVYNNRHHGIVLYQRSDANLVEGNTVYENAAQGINVNGASANELRNNIVYNNHQDGIGVGQQASNNTLVGNEVRSNAKDGIVVYSEAANTVLQDNIVNDNLRYGVHMKSAGNERMAGNQVSGNRIGLYLNVQPVPQISQETNRIERNHEADIHAVDS